MAAGSSRSKRRMRVRAGAFAATALVVPTALLMPSAGAQAPAEPAPGQEPGSFSAPFAEPTISDFFGYPRVETDERCVEREGDDGATQPGTTQGFIDCKPAAGGLAMLPNGKNLYYDNLAGTENVELSIASEYGVVGLNDQSRVLDVGSRTWAEPSPVDGGAASTAAIEPIVPGELFRSTEDENDGSLFCADMNFLPDGRILAAGGTKYTNDPGNDSSKFGSTELYGIENARIFDPSTNEWTQTGSMHRPRWYPTMTTLGDGRQFVASGLRRLIKPVNTTGPFNPEQQDSGFGLQEGQNERETEIFDPATGQWELQGDSARRTLPLFPRMHLLPNGHVYYNAGGQSFNPLGQAADEALWNIAASYDPAAREWKDLGIPGVGVSPVPGFRGSTFSVMMPLEPGAEGGYTQATFLTGGGVTNPPSPGGYFAIRDSYLTTIDTAEGNEMSNEDASDMAATSTPASGRWYSQGTLLPTGEVLATSGADRDEVAVPGFEVPVKFAELYDPETKTWRKVGEQNQPRTYHNTAVLMPDARVLVGGHATISNAYTRNLTLPGGATAPNDGRDPTFEVYSPPYLSCAGEQADITSVRGSSDTLTIGTDVPASQIESVVAMRNSTTTHVVDADQRSVKLSILSRSGNTVTVQQAPSGNVLPPGPYMLFVNRNVDGCVKPSTAAQVSAAADGKIRPLAGCLARNAPIGPRNVGRVRIGFSRKRLLGSPRLARVASPSLGRRGKRYRYCIRRDRRGVTAVFGRGGKVELVTTTGRGHGNRKVRPGQSARRFKRAYFRRDRIGKGLFRLNRRSTRLVGVRGGKVRYFAVASKRLLKGDNRRALRVSLRRAGL